jgi:hypothetical protein
MADDGIDMEAFSLLAHEIRLDILRVFFEEWAAIDPDSKDEIQVKRSLSYSEIMDAVGMRDSGKFNYHLEQLRGVYIEKIDDAYIPTGSAIAFYQTLLAQRPTEMADTTDFDIDMECPRCTGSVRGRYEQDSLTIDCADCDDWWGITYSFPKNGLRDRSGVAILDALSARATYQVGLARTGQCPACAGEIAVDIPRDRLDDERIPTAELQCETCSWVATMDLLNVLQFDSRVAATLVDLGIVLEEDESGLPEMTGTLESEDPVRVELRLETDDGTGTIVIDDELTVQSVAVDR